MEADLPAALAADPDRRPIGNPGSPRIAGRGGRAVGHERAVRPERDDRRRVDRDPARAARRRGPAASPRDRRSGRSPRTRRNRRPAGPPGRHRPDRRPRAAVPGRASAPPCHPCRTTRLLRTGRADRGGAGPELRDPVAGRAARILARGSPGLHRQLGIRDVGRQPAPDLRHELRVVCDPRPQLHRQRGAATTLREMDGHPRLAGARPQHVAHGRHGGLQDVGRDAVTKPHVEPAARPGLVRRRGAAGRRYRAGARLVGERREVAVGDDRLEVGRLE